MKPVTEFPTVGANRVQRFPHIDIYTSGLLARILFDWRLALSELVEINSNAGTTQVQAVETAIFDNAFSRQASSPDIFMSVFLFMSIFLSCPRD